MDISGGLFALGGVALAGAFSEIRAWRDRRERRASSLDELRRATYATAQRQVEALAIAMAKWANEGAPASEVWSALSAAYATKTEVNLIAGSSKVGEAMVAALLVYRSALEAGQPTLPKPRAERLAMLQAFRRDLGLKD